MNVDIVRIPVRDLKGALDRAMSLAASHSNRVGALYELAKSKVLEPAAFQAIIGQHPDTLERDLRIAHQEFEYAKSDYEEHCKRAGVPAYAVYSED